LRRATRGKLERLGDVLQDADGADRRITGNALEEKELLREVRMLGALRQRKKLERSEDGVKETSAELRGIAY